MLLFVAVLVILLPVTGKDALLPLCQHIVQVIQNRADYCAGLSDAD